MYTVQYKLYSAQCTLCYFTICNTIFNKYELFILHFIKYIFNIIINSITILFVIYSDDISY